MNYQNAAEKFMEMNYQLKENMVFKKIDENRMGEMALLITLADEKENIHLTALASKLNVVPSRITAIINSLLKKEYVCRLVDEKDRRKTVIRITDKGKIFCLENRKLVLNYIAEIFEKLGEEDTLEYLRIYEKICLINWQTIMKRGEPDGK